MKRVRLSPFVEKIKGAKNWVLYDHLRKKLFHVNPTGDLKAFTESLLKASLIYETDGIVLNSFKHASIAKYKEQIKIRQLQIRINEKCQHSCKDCGSLCSCKKSDNAFRIDSEVLNIIFKQFEGSVIKNLLITGGNPFLERDLLKDIKKNLSAQTYSIKYRFFKDEEDTSLGYSHDFRVPIEPNINTFSSDPHLLFLNKHYNPCWGEKIAIDCDGAIKICLWDNNHLGNIKEKDVFRMVSEGEFDQFWELSKDKIETCKDCEFRYGCADCRVISESSNRNIFGKYALCSYSPYSGQWHK